MASSPPPLDVDLENQFVSPANVEVQAPEPFRNVDHGDLDGISGQLGGIRIALVPVPKLL